MAKEEGKRWKGKTKAKENITWLINSHKIRQSSSENRTVEYK